ncbi:ABC exporter membrane fusion protein [Calothrix sp. PCC 6303]|uniref:ABC exporter membrane fusion protein n=1 Tax=Calothrix sp. PCC 6303 TaxID=1170562 RepID=UPI0002A00910|nr:ABC exporter membrane fusion protein [Calothrix sp. PCC 6303]AFZ00753.1 ABC exporter membrane fusion protein, DevB family [Calothrix sp. PCC 6303]
MTLDSDRPFFKHKPLFPWHLLIAIPIVLGGIVSSSYGIYKYQFYIQKQSTEPIKITPTKIAVIALGKIVPQGEVTRLSPPSSLSGVRAEKILVKEGQIVKAGQVLAWLEGYKKTAAAVQQSVENVKVARAKLAQIQAGAKIGDINAQKAVISSLQAQLEGEISTQSATITRLAAQVENADAENQRYQMLLQQGAVSVSVADSKRLQMQTVEQELVEGRARLNRSTNILQDQLREARAKLASLSEVRPVDVQLAEAEVKSAIASLQQSQAEHELTYVTTPIAGKLLKVHSKTGEVIGSEGVAQIGKTSQMYVVAEVYQTDLEKVHIAQKAIITSTAFKGKIIGTVSDIGLQVERQSIVSINPSPDSDRRVVKVKIRIDNPQDSQRVSGLTNLQVDVAIQISNQ